MNPIWKPCFFCFIIISTLLSFISLSISGQNFPGRDNFNVIFENNFNDDHTGSYLMQDFGKDWNLNDGSTAFGNVEILSDDILHDKVMRAFYPIGTIEPSKNHGFSWYSNLPSNLSELYFSFDVRFKPGFQWVLGGKIPGIVGGSVISGQLPTSTSGFSSRFVWKEGGALLLYLYHPDQKGIYGDVYYFNNFTFETGRWYNLTMRLVLNSVSDGSAYSDGILEGYVDGKLMFQKTGVRFRLNSNIQIDRMYICSFFGGNGAEWVAARDEWIDTDNYIAFIYSDKISDIPRGNQGSSKDRQLLHPLLPIDDSSWKKSLRYSSIDTVSVTLEWDNYPVPINVTLEKKELSETEYTSVVSLPYGTSTFTDNLLRQGIAYNYRLRAGSVVSDAITITAGKPLFPIPPSNLVSLYQGKTQVTLQWSDNSNNETGFNIFRSNSSSAGFTKIGSVPANISTFNDYYLTPGTTYYYRINAYNNDGVSPYTTTLQIATLALQLPNSPSGLMASGVDYNSVSLIWTDNADNENSFDIERAIAGKFYDYALHLPADAVSYTDTTLEMNTRYQYRIRTKNEAGYSAWSDHIIVETPLLTKPLAPTSLKSIKSTENSISLSWKDNSSNEDAFIVTRSLISDPQKVVDFTISANDTIFTDSSLTPGTTYVYTLHAVNSVGRSVPSNKNIISTLSQAELKRVRENLIAYYNFSYNPDFIVYDQSAYCEPVDLKVLDSSAIQWNTGHSLDILSNTALVSTIAATKIINAIKETNALSFECWVKPREPEISTHSRIVSLSASDEEVGFLLDQELVGGSDNKSLNYSVRLQTESTVPSGYPEFQPAYSQPYLSLQHIVYVKDTSGNESLYLNGIKTSDSFRPSNVFIWKDNYFLRLGNESDMAHSWKGSFYSVAMYNKALTPAEILKNFSAGPCDNIIKEDINYSVELYPNPVNDKAYLKITPRNISDAAPQIRIAITDIFGKYLYTNVVFNPFIQNIATLDFSTFQNGVYFVNVSSGQEHKTEKVIVIR